MARNTPAAGARCTIRTIATRANVSSATVSLALRQHPRISESTRRKVLRAAEELNYRPDPQVAKLMHHLRVQRPPGFQSMLCALTTLPEANELPYVKEILRSMRERAEAFGYGLMVVRLEDDGKPRPDLDRVLRTRGVEGILLLPMQTPRNFKGLLNWKNYSVVATTNAVLAPEFHRVVPHQFNNMLLLCEQLARLSYRRIGLVLDARHDLTVNHGFSAAVVWHNVLGGTEQVMPLIADDARPQDLQRWYTAEKPDVIIASGDAQAQAIARQLGLRIPGSVGFAIANRLGTARLGGIDERPAEIGATAVRLIASLLQHGEKGIPAVPTVTMVKGKWAVGGSLRTRRAGASAGRSLQALTASR